MTGPAPVEEHRGLPVLQLDDALAWDAWLTEHGQVQDGCWLLHAKKGSGLVTVTYDDAVDVALCHGWIDGLLNRRDERAYLIRYTPRRRRSAWSQVNRERVERLVAAGRMLPTGLAEVERARADGRWERAYAPASRIEVPDDLRTALAAAGRDAAWSALPAQDRYAVLHRLHAAKRPETRVRQIAALVARLGG